MSIPNRSIHILIPILIIFIGNCAYFNTYYNAKEYFGEAENLRLQKDGQPVPISAIEKYGKAVEKCQKVLKDFPQSKYVIDAMLLMGKSRYYRSDFDLAINDLNLVNKTGTLEQSEEALYWKALCKWKKGNTQGGFNELGKLLEGSKNNYIKAKCHLSLAEISTEMKEADQTLFHLQNAAKLTKVRSEKDVIYSRLADIAYNKEEYDLAIEGYDNVIANSLSKDKIENAHLQILKIYRIQKKYKTAEKKIKGMLVDDKFLNISGNLELELVQLYKAQGEKDDIEPRLESIVNDYQRTSVSAEAYFQLGQIYSSEKWNLDKAKEYYDMVPKEFNRSLFSPIAKNFSNAIILYQNAESDLNLYATNVQNEIDITVESKTDSSLSTFTSNSLPERTIPELYYQIADLEAFNFKRYDEAIFLLNKIINEYPNSNFKVKSMFALAYIYDIISDSASAKKLREYILTDYPETDYAGYLNNGIKSEIIGHKSLFIEAENQTHKDIDNAIRLYKSAIAFDTLSEYAVYAAYSIGYYYDQEAIVDSAIKYYKWINDHHPETDQSKQASIRLNRINLAISSIGQDSSESNIEEQN